MNIVKELRKKKGIQQKELAISIGVSRPIVSEWESGKKDPSGERLRKLAEFFNVDELVVLGKGFADSSLEADIPKTPEARIMAAGMDKLPKEMRQQALAIMQAAFIAHADDFKMKGDEDDSEL